MRAKDNFAWPWALFSTEGTILILFSTQSHIDIILPAELIFSGGVRSISFWIIPCAIMIECVVDSDNFYRLVVYRLIFRNETIFWIKADVLSLLRCKTLLSYVSKLHLLFLDELRSVFVGWLASSFIDLYVFFPTLGREVLLLITNIGVMFLCPALSLSFVVKCIKDLLHS